MVVGILEIIYSQWKYCCDILHKREEYGLRIKHHEWLEVQVQIQLEKGTERMKVEDHHLVQMTFRELWAQGGSNKIIWLCAVYIARGKEMGDRERFSGQRFK